MNLEKKIEEKDFSNMTPPEIYKCGIMDLYMEAQTILENFTEELCPYIIGLDAEEIAEKYIKALDKLLQ